MPRRKQSFFEDVIEVTAMVPWWVGIVLAIVSYVVLHQVASMDLVYPANGKGVGNYVGKQIYKTAAFYLQFVLPLLLLIGAALSGVRRHKRNALHALATDTGTRDAVEVMSWREFEQLVGEYFRRRGFSVEETGGGGADGGVDLAVSRGTDRYLVQCKQWKARQVGVTTVRELYGVMAAKGAAGGYVVTSGVFTDEARRFAEGREIELIGGNHLVEMIGAQSARSETRVVGGGDTTRLDSRFHGNDKPRSVGGAHPTRLDTGLHWYDGQNVHEESSQRTDSPTCPQCGSSMVLRTARKGSNAGSSFWGCPQFPKCRGTRPAQQAESGKQ